MKLMTGWVGKDFRKARFGNQNARSKMIELLKPDPIYPKEKNLWKKVFKIPENKGIS
jgi:hypothetical protein